MTVVIGIDPHKASHTATAIGPGSVEAATIGCGGPLDTAGLLSWAPGGPSVAGRLKVARGLGQLLAQPRRRRRACCRCARLAVGAGAEASTAGHGRKTDGIDAAAVALVAAQRPDLPRVAADDHHCVLRLLSDRRDELTRERRRTINRLHRHLRDLIAGGAPTQLSAKTAAGLLAKVRPRDGRSKPNAR